MSKSKFKHFLRGLPGQIKEFKNKADEVNDCKHDACCVRSYSAAYVLAWVIKKDGVTLKEHQLVTAWFLVYRQTWALIDFKRFVTRDVQSILLEINSKIGTVTV